MMKRAIIMIPVCMTVREIMIHPELIATALTTVALTMTVDMIIQEPKAIKSGGIVAKK